MATVEQIARASLLKVLAENGDAPDFDQTEYQDFMFSLNNFMTALAAEGISLGYTIVSNLSDTVTVPVGALRGVIANMALEVCPEYGIPVPSATLVTSANAGMEAMRQIGQLIPESSYPSTLPLGSGNYDEQFGIGNFFYPDQEAEILGESTGSIGLETNTRV